MMKLFVFVTLAALILVTSAACIGAEKRPLVFGINRVGNSGPIFNPPKYDEHIYQRVSEVGSTVVRLAASPREIEAVRGIRKWDDFDHDLALCMKYGLEPMVCVVNTPAWASVTGEATHLYPYKTELLPEFTDLCRELAERTKGKVKYFQIWNEQNGCSWHFHDGFNHADEYVPVLRAAYKGLKAGNPDCLVFLGGLDDAEGHGPIFMRKTYEERDKQFPGERIFDGVTDHPYSDDTATMKKKLDAIREIMIANGDGDMPIWITEYGWHSSHMPEKDRADRVRKFLDAFSQPEWSFLQGAIQLTVADFEGSLHGFGVVDANLRPRESFYAFQGAPRFGASPPYNIQWKPIDGNSMEITWKTVLPTTGYAALRFNQGRTSRLVHSRTPSNDHRVVVSNLSRDGITTFRINTFADNRERYTSAEYTIRHTRLGLVNGDFETGFFGGIAEGWTITGENFCAEMGLVPDAPKPNGKNAQAILAYGKMGQKLNGTAHTYCIAPAGKSTITAKWASEVRDSNAKVQARMGIDPTGGNDPSGRSIIWTEWFTPGKNWDTGNMRHSVESNGTPLGVFFQCRSEGDLGQGMAIFYLDDVVLSDR